MYLCEVYHWYNYNTGRLQRENDFYICRNFCLILAVILFNYERNNCKSFVFLNTSLWVISHIRSVHSHLTPVCVPLKRGDPHPTLRLASRMWEALFNRLLFSTSEQTSTLALVQRTCRTCYVWCTRCDTMRTKSEPGRGCCQTSPCTTSGEISAIN